MNFKKRLFSHDLNHSNACVFLSLSFSFLVPFLWNKKCFIKLLRWRRIHQFMQYYISTSVSGIIDIFNSNQQKILSGQKMRILALSSKHILVEEIDKNRFNLANRKLYGISKQIETFLRAYRKEVYRPPHKPLIKFHWDNFQWWLGHSKKNNIHSDSRA